ncbi:MAG: hypothetical protein U0M42_06760 [Acutalibacteraceae bacterium]|nr:hypothetical protein [Acutalibacteraceae bacterium]
MDINKWERYEQKKKEIKKQYKRKFVTISLVWLLIVAIVITALVLIKDLLGIEVRLIIGVVFLGFSAVIALNKIGEYIKAMKQQEALLEQEEPFGRFRT